MNNRTWAQIGLLTLTLACLGLAGCSSHEEDFRVLVNNANGVVVDSKVFWKGAEVGRVSVVRPESGRILLGVELFPDYRGQIREGLVAKPLNGIFTKFTPVLDLYGGDDPASLPLAHGALVPEATDVQSLRHGPYLKWAGIAGIFLFIALILKGVRRLLALALAGLFLAASLWVLQQQWRRHKADLIGPETEAQLSELANKTIRSPEAAEAWTLIRADVQELIAETKAQGAGVTSSAWVKVDAEIRQRAATLISQGNTTAAKELSEFSQRVGEMIAPHP
jgi:uncharacterized protein YcfL